MKHNADQFDLFPPTRPAVGQLVHLMGWTGKKWQVDRSKQWRVISPALWYLLSGNDPDELELEDGTHGWRLTDDEIPLLATAIRKTWGRPQSDFLQFPMICQVSPREIARGF